MRTLTTLFTLLLLLGAWPVLAASEMRMVTGSRTGTYIALGQDIADTARTVDIDLKILESGGSIDNIKRLAGGKEDLALGIVQSDVLGFLQRSRNPKSIAMANRLRMVFPLYREEVHLLAKRDIARFQDLAGKRVVVGDEGSGSLVTSVNLFSMMNTSPAETLRLPPAEGVLAVLKGEADAMIFVGGKPVRLFKNLESLSSSKNAEASGLLADFHFLPLNDPAMLKEYGSSSIGSKDYSWVTEPVPTITVTAILVSPDFSSPVSPKSKLHCTQLRNLAEALRANIANLQENGHPKWREVELDARPGIWKRDSCSWPANQIPNVKAGERQEDLLTVIKGERQ